MSWNLRVVKTKDGDSETVSVREVFYNPDGGIYAYMKRPVEISFDSVNDIRSYLKMIEVALEKDVLIEEDIRIEPMETES